MKRFFAIIGVAVLFTGIFIYANFREKGNAPLIYSEESDRVILTADDTDFTLRDLAFYIGFQENKVNVQAELYDPDHPRNYWNGHTNGEFIKVLALESAMDMMLHDWYYNKMAESSGLTLDEEELELVKETAEDYWSDLSEKGKKSLGIDEKQVYDTCIRIARSEKIIGELSRETGRDMEVYQCGGKAWEEARETLSVHYDDELKRRIPMGTITLED